MKTTYIALLRGINVGGHKVKMERLRELFAELGFSNVRSYINSGNIFFDSDSKNQDELTGRIEKHLTTSLGYEVPVFLRTIPELEHILAREAFKDIELTPDKRFCVVFTNEPLHQNLELPIQSSKGDMDLVHTTEYEAFLVWHIINGRPPAGKFSTDVLPARSTSRFYHTLSKILKAAKNK